MSGERNSFSALLTSSSINGSVATLSGLVQLPFGAENAELPQDETDESENDEHMDAERWNAGRLLSRISLISSHSFAGLLFSANGLICGAGVLGGVTRRWMAGRGASRPSEDDVGSSIGLDISDTASDISIVGITVSEPGSGGGSSNGTTFTRLLFSLYVCRGGGGGSTADCCSSFRSGVLGSWPSS